MEATYHILVVEDDELLSELIAFKLRHAGYSVDIAENGEKALVSVSDNKPTAIILDVMMAGLDGMQVLKQLKDNDETMDIPVLMLSARSMEADIVRALSDGADEYVTKPFMVDELIVRLSKMIRRNVRR